MKDGEANDSQKVNLQPLNSKMLRQLKDIYEDDSVRGFVLSRIAQKGCSKEEALDLFQDAMIIMMNKYRKGDLKKVHAASNYVYRIVFNLWLNRHRKKKEARLEDTQLDIIDDQLIEDYYDREAKSALLDMVIAQVSARCRQLLNVSRLGHSTEEIADIMEYGSLDRVRKERYRCLNKARAKLASNEDIKALAKELNY